jgi:DNA-binding CsgD family transcriptional regulator
MTLPTLYFLGYSTLGLVPPPNHTVLGLEPMMISVSELAFHQRLGRVLDQAKGDGFWPAFSAFLRYGIAFDSWVAMIYREDMAPLVLYEGDGDLLGDALFDEYVGGLYRLDPFYLFSMGGFTPGLYRLDEVAPEHFRETDYYHRYFAHNVVADEVQFLTPLEGQGVLSLSLGSKQQFTEDEIGSLCLYAPWILPLLQIPSHTKHTGSKDGIIPAMGLEEQLRRRGAPNLTDREIQTAMLLLAGHSTKGIAAQMGISPETVKVHRRNLYDKLGVSTEAGIFALFLKSNS